MSHKFSRLEHPWPAVIMHWAHLLSFFVLIVTGLEIHAHSTLFGTIENAHETHSVVMAIFLLTTITRIYWAFFGAGSAALGGTVRHRDWRFFGLNMADIKSTPSWIAYYLFLRKEKPHVVKYGSLQKLTYGILFPLGILVIALSGFAMFPPTMASMAWFANIFGGLNGVRLMHYLTMWVLIMFFMIHLYLVIVEEPAQAAIMLAHTVPPSMRVPGDYSDKPSGSTGTAGQKA